MVMGPVHALTRTALSVFVTSSWHWLMVVGAVLSSTQSWEHPPVRDTLPAHRQCSEPNMSQYTGLQFSSRQAFAGPAGASTGIEVVDERRDVEMVPIVRHQAMSDAEVTHVLASGLHLDHRAEVERTGPVQGHVLEANVVPARGQEQ